MFRFSIKKIGIESKEVDFEDETKTIHVIKDKKLSSEQIYYLESFIDSCSIPIQMENSSL